MSTEKVKDIALVFSIILSLGLTWYLLNFQPNYTTIDTEDYVQSIKIGEEKTVNEVIIPSSIYIQNENSSYLSYNSNLRTRPFSFLQDSELTKVEDITDLVKESLVDFMYKNNQIVWEYEDAIPISVYNKVFSFDKDLNNYLIFDRVVIPFSNNTIEKIYFISTDKERIFEGELEDTKQHLFKTFKDNVEEGNNSVFVYQLSDSKATVLPKEAITTYSLNYITKTIEADLLKDTLFPNPNYVESDIEESEEIYTDGTRILKISSSNQRLEFLGPNVTDKNYLNTSQLFSDSIDFLNSHGGFTDMYMLDTFEQSNGFIKLRMYKDNWPIYSDNGNDSLELQLSSEEVIEYKRPIYKLHQNLLKRTEVTLQSGYTLIDELKASQKIDMGKVTDIFIAYRMEKSVIKNNDIVELVPSWYVTYNEKDYLLSALMSEIEKGELRDGLE